MDYDIDVVLRAGIIHQAAVLLSILNTKATDKSDIGDEIPVVTVTKLALSRQNKLAETSPDTTVNGTTEPNLPTLNELSSAHCTAVYCDEIVHTVEMPG